MDFLLTEAIGRFGLERDLASGHITPSGDAQGEAIQPWWAAAAFSVCRVNLEGEFLLQSANDRDTRKGGLADQGIVRANKTPLAGRTEMDGNMVRP